MTEEAADAWVISTAGREASPMTKETFEGGSAGRPSNLGEVPGAH
jgi:hypothetical protein